MRYRVPPRVAHLVTEAGTADNVDGALRVSLLRLPDGVPLTLTEAAALIWLIAAEGSADVVEDVARGASQPRDAIRADVESFLCDLVGRGLLEPVDDSDEERPTGAGP
jgi:hypothetical protein